ncbi:hypothetical protein HMN09_01084600 [Mycena chlorophos]|uniref:Cytochrome P450 n=1 Tax=Mycena chlorophos TaxID=658473 RepID=A0A8H6VW80_MYCCL|nr:hypothetical protein HMN09_01084600 [Mycena chlorophos]
MAMSPIEPIRVATSLLLAGAAYIIVQIFNAALAERRRARCIKNIRGPPSTSWIFGNLLEMHIPQDYGEADHRWLEEFGSVYRIKAAFGRDRLVISDPLALQFVLNGEDFTFAPARQTFISWIFGERGILAQHGSAHRNLRSVLNIGFTAAAVRSYLPSFRQLSEVLCDSLEEKINKTASGTAPTVMDLIPFLNTATLGAISEAAFGCRVDDLSPDLVKTNSRVTEFASTVSASHVFLDEVLDLDFLPKWALTLAGRYPIGPALSIARDQNIFATADGTKIINHKLRAAKEGTESLDEISDVYEKIIHGEILGNPTPKISIDDLIGQTSTMMIAGQDTVATTLGWLFIALAQHQDVQNQLRHEISNIGEGDAYDKCPLLNAVIKETMRLWPVLPISFRIAINDAVIPLSQPILSADGSRIDTVPVLKGQLVTLSSFGYERQVSINYLVDGGTSLLKHMM